MLRISRTVAARVPGAGGTRHHCAWDTSVSAYQAKFLPRAPRAPATSPPRTELLDIWIACEGKMLLTRIHDDDYDFLAHAWDDVYQLSERIGPFTSSRYGLLVDFVDDRHLYGARDAAAPEP